MHLAGVTHLVVLKDIISPMGYVAGNVTCLGTCYVTQKYLVFKFAKVVPCTSVVIKYFVPVQIAKTVYPRFMTIRTSKMFNSIAEVHTNFLGVWL